MKIEQNDKKKWEESEGKKRRDKAISKVAMSWKSVTKKGRKAAKFAVPKGHRVANLSVRRMRSSL